MIRGSEHRHRQETRSNPNAGPWRARGRLRIDRGRLHKQDEILDVLKDLPLSHHGRIGPDSHKLASVRTRRVYPLLHTFTNPVFFAGLSLVAEGGPPAHPAGPSGPEGGFDAGADIGRSARLF